MTSGVKVFLTLFICFFIVSGAVFAQTVSNQNLKCVIPPGGKNPCTSNDLQVVGVFVDAPKCTACKPGDPQTYPLKMTIHNGTNSVRTSFALYGTLSPGAKLTVNNVDYTGNIFICVGKITAKSNETLPGETAPGNQTFEVGTISFTCGQELTLTNDYLAWTDASGTTADRCNTFSKATSCADIAPKCGTAASITIKQPVVAPTLGGADPTCTTNTGSITLTPTTGSTYSFDGGQYLTYPNGGWQNLAAGSAHTVSEKNSDGCTSPNASRTIGTAPANPDRPVVTLQEATICGSLTAPTITVSCPIAGTYTLTQAGVAGSQTFTYNGSNGPVVFTVQAGKQFSITVTNTDGCTSAATNCTNYATNSCPAGNTTAKPAVQTIELAAPTPSVIAAPNPFNDRIRFSLQSAVSGQGSLDLYNMLGQKVKTVFQGQVEAGKVQTIEYSVPGSQRHNLIYLFRVGDQKVSGKLIGLK